MERAIQSQLTAFITKIRLRSNNSNRDNGIEIPEAWMPTIRKHNSRSTTKRTREGTSTCINSYKNKHQRA